jgi:uncharacterized membrane protein
MFRRYLSREIDHWIRTGLLEPEKGQALLKDHDRRHTGFSLSSVLAVLAGLLLGGAVMALIAANWEAIARPARVVMIVAFVVGAVAAAAIAVRRNAHWVMEAALVFAVLCYGAGIALVGQMYHLSGDEAAFMLTWTIGALVVSVAFSSAMAAIGAGLLGLGYLFAEAAVFDFRSVDLINMSGYLTVLAVAVAIGVSAWRSRSVVAGHLCTLLSLGWLIWVFAETMDSNPGYMLAVIGAAAFVMGSLASPVPAGAVARHGVVSTYGAFLILVGLGVVQIDLHDVSLVWEMVLAGLILAASVVILSVAGRENRLIRTFSYFAFACETVYVVSETLGSLLGSSGFLFAGGVVLAVVAFLVMKIEKRFKSREGLS